MALENDFNLLDPVAITETELVSGIPDAENQIYSAVTAYSLGDLVWYSGKVWEALGSVTGTTPGTASPDEWEDLGQVDEGASVYDPSTTYNTDDYAVYQGYVWQCAADATLGETPATTSTLWTQVGATNRLKAFDGFIQDEATLNSNIPYVIQTTELITDIAILRATGDTVDIVMTDATEGEVYNDSFDLQDDSGIIDAWTYCFNPFAYFDTLTIEDLPPFAGAEIAITINGGAPTVGQIVLGSKTTFGFVKVGSSVGIESYSIKDRDSFNRSIVVARPYSDTATFDLSVPLNTVGYAKRELAKREATPTLFFMSGGALLGMVAYGFFRDFEILHSTTVYADCVLEIEGLG